MKKCVKLFSLFISVIIAISSLSFSSFAEETSTKVFQSSLATKETVNIHELTLKNPSKVSYTIEHNNLNSSGVYWNVALYNSDDELLGAMDVKGDATSLQTINYYLSAGKYYIKVKYGGYWHSTEQYTIKVNYTNNNGKYESEKNNTLKKANAVELNKAITGNIYSSGDVDYYMFKLEKSGRIILNFNHANLDINNIFWKIELFNKDEEKILSESSRGNLPKLKSANAYLSKGTYYVKISANSAYTWNLADYSLTVKYKENSGQYEAENNDTIKKANLIATNKYVTGNTSAGNDADYFKFNITEKSNVSLIFKHANLDSSSNYWKITLYNSDEEQLLTFNSAGNTPKLTSDTITLSAGTYYIKVTPMSIYTYSLSDYSIAVSNN